MLRRLITGDGLRKTRFHNYRGEFLDLGGFIYLPHAIGTTLNLKLLGRRPEIPWLGFRAIKRLNELIRPDWKVLEFGSGMSTLWLAKRCARLISIETDPVWHQKVGRTVSDLANVDYRLVSIDECHLVDEDSFNLVIVDGQRRDAVMQTALRTVVNDGYVYLDNSDVPWSEYSAAQDLLRGHANRIEVFNDLCPTRIAVNEGLLAQVRARLA